MYCMKQTVHAIISSLSSFLFALPLSLRLFSLSDSCRVHFNHQILHLHCKTTCYLTLRLRAKLFGTGDSGCWRIVRGFDTELAMYAVSLPSLEPRINTVTAEQQITEQSLQSTSSRGSQWRQQECVTAWLPASRIYNTSVFIKLVRCLPF